MVEMDETYEMLKKLNELDTKPSKIFLFELMKQLRKLKIRRSDIVVKYGPDLFKSSFDDKEVWNLYEQVFIAAVDIGEQQLADDCLIKLTKRFPRSDRVLRLVGMNHEGKGDYTRAMEIYNQLLKENPANILVMKRKAAVYRSQDQLTESVLELHKILRYFPSDAATWLELADIHLLNQDFVSAAHCQEEVVLIDPRNAHAHTRLADCYYSLQGPANLITARKHYALSLELQSPALNLRAVHSLIACCDALKSFYPTATASSTAVTGSSSSSSGAGATVSIIDQLVNEEMRQWAVELLEEIESTAAAGAGNKNRGTNSSNVATIMNADSSRMKSEGGGNDINITEILLKSVSY